MHLFELFSWSELTITNDSERFSKIVHGLKAANIPYKTKVQNIGHGDRHNGQIGALGENPQYAVLYQVFTKKGFLEQAKRVI